MPSPSWPHFVERVAFSPRLDDVLSSPHSKKAFSIPRSFLDSAAAGQMAPTMAAAAAAAAAAAQQPHAHQSHHGHQQHHHHQLHGHQVHGGGVHHGGHSPGSSSAAMAVAAAAMGQLWARTQQLPREALLQLQTTVYGDHFPLEVRHALAGEPKMNPLWI